MKGLQLLHIRSVGVLIKNNGKVKMGRRVKPPWTAERIAGGYVVTEAAVRLIGTPTERYARFCLLIRQDEPR